MSEHRENQNGFAVLQAVLVLVSIGIIGFTGWFVWHTKQNSDKTFSEANRASILRAETTKKNLVATQHTYLDIKEWGVKLALSTTVADSYYVVSTNSETGGQPNTMWLGLKSLDRLGCAAVQANSGGEYPVGSITKSLPDATNPVSGELLTKVNPNGVTLNGYYYAYHSELSSSTGCMTKNNVKNAAEIDAAFKTAGDSIVKD